MHYRIGTRGSKLALVQSEYVKRRMEEAYPEDTFELVIIKTTGDKVTDKPLAAIGTKGLFVKEIEEALLSGSIDMAVHSMKDMPAEVLPEFKLAAVLKREDPRDAFIARGGAAGIKFMDLPAGARVGTGSIRRVVQLKALRPDLEYVPIRGNIQTRLGKLAELDAVVLAAAGLKRMGLADQVTEYFSTEQMLPASGQGILAIETLCSPSDELADQLARVNDAESYAIAVAEMAYLKALNAGCQFPVASFAEFSDAGTLALRGIYWDESSKRLLRAQVLQPLDARAADSVAQARAAGIALAQKIREQL